MDDYIKITVLENTIEAQLIDSILSEKNIPHRIRSFHDTAYDGLFQFQKGWGELFAPLVIAPHIRLPKFDRIRKWPKKTT
jgi:hypothetical protein